MKSERQASNTGLAGNEQQKLALKEKQDAREHRARMFRQWVMAGMIATGLAFMALRIPGAQASL